MTKGKFLRMSLTLALLSQTMMAETLKGRIFEDTNKNQSYDKLIDLRLKDVNVTVTDAQGLVKTVQTNKNGVFKVDGISIGEATINIDETTLPGSNPIIVTGYKNFTKNIVSGKVNWSGKYGYTFDILYGTVCGDIFLDGKLPNNGFDMKLINNVFDRSEGLEDYIVTITDVFGNTHTGLTNTNGRYCIDKIPVGEAVIDIKSNISGPHGIGGYQNSNGYLEQVFAEYVTNKINVVNVNNVNNAPVQKALLAM